MRQVRKEGDSPGVLPARQWQVPPLTPLTSGMAGGTSVRFRCRQATCRLALSQTQGCGQRWAAVRPVGPSSGSSRSSRMEEVLWGRERGGRCSRGQGPTCPLPEPGLSFGPGKGVLSLFPPQRRFYRQPFHAGGN